jgi:hypothetical protein
VLRLDGVRGKKRWERWRVGDRRVSKVLVGEVDGGYVGIRAAETSAMSNVQVTSQTTSG